MGQVEQTCPRAKGQYCKKYTGVFGDRLSAFTSLRGIARIRLRLTFCACPVDSRHGYVCNFKQWLTLTPIRSCLSGEDDCTTISAATIDSNLPLSGCIMLNSLIVILPLARVFPWTHISHESITKNTSCRGSDCPHCHSGSEPIYSTPRQDPRKSRVVAIWENLSNRDLFRRHKCVGI